MNHSLSQGGVAVDKTSEFEELLGRREICRILGISNPTFFRMIKSGRLPGRMIGGAWKVSPKALREFIDGQPTPAVPAAVSEK